MAWMSGIPHDQGTAAQGRIVPSGVVCHRTYGTWKGDYWVGKGGNPPVGFHFLIGKQPGNWVQFYDSTVRCAHAGVNAGGNDTSVGVEVEGENTDPMTDWQVARVRDIVRWLQATHGIVPVYRFSVDHDLRAGYGYVPHSGVRGATHTDYWTLADWQRIVADPTPHPPRKGHPMIFVQDPRGTIYIVGLSRVSAIANMADFRELQKAVEDPQHVASVSQHTFDLLAAAGDQS